MWPFTHESPLERKLREQYTVTLGGYGLPAAQAKWTVEQLLAVAKQQARSDPELPPNFGELLIQREVADDSGRQMLASKRAEGVTDPDIRWWWGLDNLERRLLIALDDWFRIAAWKQYRAEGMSEEQAITHLRKSFPIFGDPQNTKTHKGDDRPLPFELKDRINQWAMRNSSPKTLSELGQFTSMNAAIRSEIRAGRL